MKGMILCKSNVIQKHNEKRGKEILKVGESVAFATTAQERMEFGNGTQGRCIPVFLEAEHGGVRRGLGENGGQGILVPSEGPGGEGAVAPAPLPESSCRQGGTRTALPGAARGCREAGLLLPTAQLFADRRGSREMSPCCCRAGAAHADGVRQGPAPQPGGHSSAVPRAAAPLRRAGAG